jgi:hypothetical protein
MIPLTFSYMKSSTKKLDMQIRILSGSRMGHENLLKYKLNPQLKLESILNITGKLELNIPKFAFVF